MVAYYVIYTIIIKKLNHRLSWDGLDCSCQWYQKHIMSSIDNNNCLSASKPYQYNRFGSSWDRSDCASWWSPAAWACYTISSCSSSWTRTIPAREIKVGMYVKNERMLQWAFCNIERFVIGRFVSTPFNGGNEKKSFFLTNVVFLSINQTIIISLKHR